MKLLHRVAIARRIMPSPRRGRTGRQPRPQHPRGIERRFRLAIRALTTTPLIPLLQARIAPALRMLVSLQPAAVNVHDRADEEEEKDAVDRLFGDVRIQYQRIVPPSERARVAKTAARETADWNATQISKGTKAVLGIDPIAAEPWIGPLIDEQTKLSVRAISGIADDFLDSFETDIRSGLRAGLSSDALAEKISGYLDPEGDDVDKADRRAAFIARNQIAGFNSDLSRIRQQAMGVDRYRWRTSMDERVRPEHARREGRIFDWDDPPEDGHAGTPFNCRCTAEAVLEDIIDDDEA